MPLENLPPLEGVLKSGTIDPITQNDIVGLNPEDAQMLYGVMKGDKPETHAQLQSNPLFQGRLTNDLKGYIPTIHNREYFAAHNQGPMELLGNAITQIGSEIVLGTIEAVGYLADIPNWTEAWSEGTKEFDNELSRWAREAKQTISEDIAPVYDSPWSEGFNPLSGRWWAKNSGTVGTALSLMIPSGFVGKAAGTALKAARISQTAKIATQGMAAAITSRHAESLMEANQTYDELIRQGLSEEAAGEGAAKSYRDNTALLATDFFQYAFLFGAGNKALASVFSRSKTKSNVFLEGLKQAPFEGAEEAYQFITSEEAKGIAEGTIEPGAIWGKGISERFSDYARNEELWTSAFLGAVTGMAMPVAMDGISYAYDKIMGIDKVKEEANMMEQLASLGDETKSDYYRDKKFMSMAFQHASRGTMSEMENMLKARLEETDGDEHAKVQRYLEQIPEFEEIFNRVQNRPDYTRKEKFENIEDTNRQLKTQMILDAWDLKQTSKLKDKLLNDYDTTIGQQSESELPSDTRDLKRLYDLNTLYDSGQMRSEFDGDEKAYKARREQVKSELETAIKEHPKNLSDTDLRNLLSTSADDKIRNIIRDIEKADLKLKELKKAVALVKTDAGQLKLLQEIDKKKGEERKEYEEYLSNFLGEGVVLAKDNDQWDIAAMEDKFMLKKTGNPDLPATTDPFTDEEYEKFTKSGTISDGRLAQVANKIKNGGEALTRKERAVEQAKKEEIGALLQTNQNNNNGKGFSRYELMEWMQNNGYRILDDTIYQNKREQGAIKEKKKELADDNVRLANALANHEATYNRLAETLTGRTEDALTIRGMDNLLTQIEKIKDKMRSNEIELASLNQPTKLDREAFRKKAKKFESAAEEFFGKKIDQLQAHKRSLAAQTKKLGDDAVALREIYNEIQRNFRQKQFQPKKHYARLQEVNADLQPIEAELNKIQADVEQADQDIQYYKNQMDDIAGENLVNRQNELNAILDGSEDTKGLRWLIAEAIANRNDIQKKVDEITEDLLKFFDVPKDKLNDQAYINDVLSRAEKLNDDDINELVKQARKKEQYDRLLQKHKDDVNQLLQQIEPINKELADLDEIERIAYPKKNTQKVDKGEDVRNNLKTSEFNPKKSAQDAFNFLRGRHFDGDTITDLEHHQRYFKFVETTSFTGNKLYVKLVPYAINGKPTEWSVLLTDVEKQRLRDSLGDKYEETVNNMIFAVIVDNEKRPVNLYREQIQSENPIDVLNYGIFTTFPDGNTNTIYNNGERYDGTPEELEESKKRFMKAREAIVENLNANTAVYLNATSKSVGRPIEDTRKPAIGTVINPQKSEIVVAKKNQLVFQGRNFSVTPGTVYLRDLLSGQINQVYPRQLNEQEKNTIIELLKKANELSYEKNPFEVRLDELGKRTIKEVLKEYLHYSPETVNNTGGYIYEKTDLRTDKFTGQMYLEGLGPMDLKDLVESEPALREWLDKQYHQVRSTSETGEYTQVAWSEANKKFTFNKHPSYKDYLLNPDLAVLESTLPKYTDDVSQPQKKNSNVYFDYSNPGYDEVPGKTSTKVPTGRQSKPKPATRTKKTPGSPVLDAAMMAAMNDALGEIGGEFTATPDADPKPTVIPEAEAKKAFGKSNFIPKKKFGSKNRTVQYGSNFIYEDLNQAQAWFEERFPGVPFKVAYDLAKSGAWGRFTSQGEVLIDPSAEIGTTYHEAFHAVMGLYLSPREVRNVLDDYRKTTGDTSLNDSEIEEVLAEAFRDFVLTGETIYGKKTPNFFARLLNFLKWILGIQPVTIHEVFENINNGYYSKFKPDFSRVHEDKNRSFKDKDATFSRDVVEGINYMFWESIPEGQLMEEIISNTIDGSLLKSLYENVRGNIQEQVDQLYAALDKIPEDSYQYAHGFKLLEAREWILDNFYTSEGPSVVEMHQEHLSQLRVDIDIPELPDTEEDVEGIDMDNQWSEVSGEVSGKKTVSNQVKLWLSIIPKVDREGNIEQNDLEFEVYEDFSKMFSILSNKLANTTSIDEMNEQVEELIRMMPATTLLNKYFHLNVPSNRLTASQMQRKMQFFQAFSKGRDLFSRIIVDRGGAHSYIKVSTAGQRRKMMNDWDANFTPIILQETAAKLDSGGLLTYDEALAQAAAIGIDLPGAYLMDDRTRTEFAEHMTWVADYVRKGYNPYRGREIEVFDPEAGQTVTIWEPSNVQGRINNIIEIAYQTTLDAIENSHIAYNGKTRYDNSQYTYHKYVNNELNKIAEEIKFLGLSPEDGLTMIYDRFPHLNNPYSADSIILKKLASGQQLETHILEGLGTADSGSREFQKTHYQDNFIAQVNNTLGGRYHMLRPADNKQERIFDWGLFLSINEVDINNDLGISAPVNMLLEYLKSEAIVLKDANVGNTQNYSIWNNLGNNLRLDSYPKYYQAAIEDGTLTPDHVKLIQSGILLSILSSPEVIPLIEDFVLEEITLDEFIYNPVVVDRMTQWFQETLNKRIIPAFRETRIADDAGDKLLHEYKDFPIETVAKLFLSNYIAGNIEQTKIFTGHPAQYKSLDDFFKRMSGMVGTKTLPAIDEDTNRYLVDNGLGKEDPIIRTAVIADPKVSSELQGLYEEILNRRYDRATAASKVERFYGDIEESDAQGYISLDEYREFKFRIGEWNWKQEAAYQWEIQGGWKGNQVIGPKNSPYEEIRGGEITQADVEKDGYFLPTMKPQYFGPIKDSNFFVNSYYKLSLLPLLPSLVETRNLQKVADKMNKQKIGILVFSTGNKLGTRLGDANNPSLPGIQSMYDTEGNIKDDVLLTQDTSYEYWGIQVNNSPKQKSNVSSGTQFLKQIESNLFYQGVPFDFQPDQGDRARNWMELSQTDRLAESATYRQINELRKLNKARQTTGTMQLIKRLGLEEEEVGGERFFKISKEKLPEVQKFLQEQFIARDLPENMIDSVRWIDRGIDFMVNREKVENILFSISDKMTVSQKKHGKSSVQVSSTFFELEGKRNYENGKFKSSDLKFYDVEYKVGNKTYTQEEWNELKDKPEEYETKVGAMEVYLPHYFKEMLGQQVDLQSLDKRLLQAIGFRIPTQGLNSIENIRIKGFLPAQSGDIVVVPSEVIAKAGSDFDFDKMFLHFPNYEMINGQPRYIEFTKSPSKIWERRKRSFSLSIPEYASDIDRIEEEYKNDISKAIIGKKISYDLWQQKMLPKLHALGIDVSNINDAINTIQDYSFNRKELIENGLLSSLQEELGFNDELEELNEFLIETSRIRENMRRNKDVIQAAKVKRDNALEQIYEKAFEEFDKLDIYEKNGKKAIENEMLRMHQALLSDYRRFDELINPISTDTFKAQANIINNLKNRDTNPQALYNIVDPTFVINKGIEFQHAKQNIGRAALNATSHILFSQANVYLNLPRGKNIYLSHNSTLQGGQIRPSLAGLKTTDGKHYISDLLSEMINAYVDAAKDPFIFQINGGPISANVMFLLIRLGVPVNDAIAFMNQPIIDDYIKGLAARRSTYLYTTGKTDWKFVDKITNKYKSATKPNAPQKAMKSLTQMRNMIEKVGKGMELNDAEKAAQLAILDQYMMLEDVSDSLRRAIWGTSYDTSAGGKNTGQLMHRLKLTEQTIDEGLLGNYERIFDKGSFLEPFYSSVKDLLDMITPYMVTLNNPGLREQIDKFVSLTMDEFEYEKTIDAMKSDLITYIVHRQLDLKGRNSLINSFQTIDGVKVRNSTVPKRVQDYKAQVARGDAAPNEFIEALSVKLAIKDPFTGQTIDNLSINSGSKIDKEDSDIYTKEWERLMITHPTLATELGEFLWLQSGLQNSPINFIDLMPNAIYADIMHRSLQGLEQNSKAFQNFYHEFFLNNSQFFKSVGSVRAIKDSWPAYKVTDSRGMVPDTKYYFNRQLLSKDKMGTVRNFRNDSTKKYFPDADFSEYVKKKSQNYPKPAPTESRRSEVDDILNKEDCGM